MSSTTINTLGDAADASAFAVRRGVARIAAAGKRLDVRTPVTMVLTVATIAALAFVRPGSPPGMGGWGGFDQHRDAVGGQREAVAGSATGPTLEPGPTGERSDDPEPSPTQTAERPAGPTAEAADGSRPAIDALTTGSAGSGAPGAAVGGASGPEPAFTPPQNFPVPPWGSPAPSAQPPGSSAPSPTPPPSTPGPTAPSTPAPTPAPTPQPPVPSPTPVPTAPPEPTPTPDPTPVPTPPPSDDGTCTDGVDNDGDLLIDLLDLGCLFGDSEFDA